MNKSAVLLFLLLVAVTEQKPTEEVSISQERVGDNSELIAQTSTEASLGTPIKVDVAEDESKTVTLIEIKGRNGITKDSKEVETNQSAVASAKQSEDNAVLRKDASKEVRVSDPANTVELYSLEIVTGTDISAGIDESTTPTVVDTTLLRVSETSKENKKYGDSNEAIGGIEIASKESSERYANTEEEYTNSEETVATRRMLFPLNVLPVEIPGFALSNAPIHNMDVSNIEVANDFDSKRNYSGNLITSYRHKPLLRTGLMYPQLYNIQTPPPILSMPAAHKQKENVHRSPFTSMQLNKTPLIKEASNVVENNHFSTSPPQHNNVLLKLIEASKPGIVHNSFFNGDFHKQPEMTNHVPYVFHNNYNPSEYFGFSQLSNIRK